MKKILLSITSILCLLAAFTFSSCTIMQDLEDAVTYPKSYSITYEVTSAEGVINTVSKTVDENGNIYVKNGEQEKLYVNNNGTYTLYKKDEEGAFVEKTDEKYTQKVVDENTVDICAYSEESKKQFMPTAETVKTEVFLNRECKIFKLGVGGKNNSAYYYYYVDMITGICLKLEIKHTALGQEVPHNSETFACIEFITEKVQDLSTGTPIPSEILPLFMSDSGYLNLFYASAGSTGCMGIVLGDYRAL